MSRDFGRQAHQRDFVIAFYAAAAGGDRRGAGQIYLRRSLGDSLFKNEADSFFKTDTSSRDAAVFHSLGHKLIGIFIFLPDPDVRVLTIALSPFAPDLWPLQMPGKRKTPHLSQAAPWRRSARRPTSECR